MAGYDGVDTLVFQVLSRVLSRAEWDVSVAFDEGAQPPHEPHTYELHAAEDHAQGVAMAKAALERLLQAPAAEPPRDDPDAVANGTAQLSLLEPTQTCPAIVRVQPYYDAIARDTSMDLFDGAAPPQPQRDTRALHFLVWWVDPQHRLSHCTSSQALPAWWRTYAY